MSISSSQGSHISVFPALLVKTLTGLMMLAPVFCDYKEITQTLMSLLHLIWCNKQNTHIPRQNKCSWTDLDRNSVNKGYLSNVVTSCFSTFIFTLIFFFHFFSFHFHRGTCLIRGKFNIAEGISQNVAVAFLGVTWLAPKVLIWVILATVFAQARGFGVRTRWRGTLEVLY